MICFVGDLKESGDSDGVIEVVSTIPHRLQKKRLIPQHS